MSNIEKFSSSINYLLSIYVTEVQCEDPQSVKDGFIEVSNFKGRYVFGSLATYHCNPGYILWGNASRLCAEDGIWTGTFSPVQDGCVQLRMDGDLQANETSTDKMS